MAAQRNIFFLTEEAAAMYKVWEAESMQQPLVTGFDNHRLESIPSKDHYPFSNNHVSKIQATITTRQLHLILSDLVHRLFFFGERKSTSFSVPLPCHHHMHNPRASLRESTWHWLWRHYPIATITYPGYNHVSRIQATSSTPTSGKREVILRNPSGCALGITQYYFSNIRERAPVGVLLLSIT